MSNGSLRVKSKTIYTIEVNDEGEEISFDLADIGLQAKIIECHQDIERESKNFDKKEKEILKAIEKEDKEEKKELFSENEKKLIYLEQEFYTKCREIMDKFMGKNACQKIFGDSNYPTMFIDLFEQLEPEFKKMGLNFKKMQKELYKKYAPKNNKVLR